MLCTDPLLTLLKDQGYCVIRLPKADVAPLLILSRQGNELDRLGELSAVLQAGKNVPLPPVRHTETATISGKRTGEIGVGLGISILGSYIGAMGGSVLGLDLKYQQASTLSFEFSEVSEDSIEVVRLDQYLSDADVSPFSRHVAELLDADEIYVTTAVLKSQQFTVEGKTEDGAGVGLKVPEIQGIVGGNLQVSGKEEVTSKIVYRGKVPLSFGFQAVRLIYENGTYQSFKAVSAGGVVMRGVNQPETLRSDATFVRLGRK